MHLPGEHTLTESKNSTDGMDKWLDDAYPDLDRRKANMIYEIASLIKDDPDTITSID